MTRVPVNLSHEALLEFVDDEAVLTSCDTAQQVVLSRRGQLLLLHELSVAYGFESPVADLVSHREIIDGPEAQEASRA